MAGGDDRNGVPTIGRAHGAYRAWVADLLGDLAVAAGFAERDGQQRPPHLLLEVGAGELQFQLEPIALAREVFRQLALGFQQHRVVVSSA